MTDYRDLQPNDHCTLQVDKEGTHFWKNAKLQLHRVGEDGVQDGPAYIDSRGVQQWYCNGKIHRLDGPALTTEWGIQEWYLDGFRMSQEEWARNPRVVEYNAQVSKASL